MAGGFSKLAKAHGGAPLPGSALQMHQRRGICSRNDRRALATTMSITAHGCASVLGGGADRKHRFRRGDGDLQRDRKRRCPIIIGANPVENHPVAATFFKQFTKRGGKLIVMDPRGVGLRRFAYQMLQFRPGTDVAMLNSIMPSLPKKAFMISNISTPIPRTAGRARPSERFQPRGDGRDFRIAPEVIRDVARTFAKARAGMISGAWACHSISTAPTTPAV